MKINLTKKLNIKSDNPKDMDTILESVYKILKSNHLLSLSTIDLKNKQPHVCCVYYVFDNELNLYIWTDPYSQHCKNITNNPRVAVDIYDSHQEWGSLLKGLQILGTSMPVNNKELLLSGALYLKRYVKASNFIKTLKDFNSDKLDSKIYKIVISKIKLLDESNFGKDIYKELLIER